MSWADYLMIYLLIGMAIYGPIVIWGKYPIQSRALLAGIVLWPIALPLAVRLAIITRKYRQK